MWRTIMSDGWAPVSTAPRDGTPVTLWMVEDHAPPVLPMTVGFWTTSLEGRIGHWRIFADPPRICSDRQIRGWMPLLG
jgi:hypothetical protein